MAAASGIACGGPYADIDAAKKTRDKLALGAVSEQ
jgi:hypothetical protein